MKVNYTVSSSCMREGLKLQSVADIELLLEEEFYCSLGEPRGEAGDSDNSLSSGS